MVNVVRGFAYPDQDQNGRVLGCFVLLLDITRERAFEAQMKSARDEAMEAICSKSRFLAAASHDLRQPLHAMTLFVSALSRRLSGGESGELVGNLDNSLRSLRAMIDTLLDISKLDAGLVKPSLAPLALNDLFAALQPGFSAVARDRGLAYRVVPTAVDGHCRPDAGRTGAAQSDRQRFRSSPAAAACWSAAGSGMAGSASRSPTPASASPPTGGPASSRSFTATRRRPTAPTKASASACRSSNAWRRRWVARSRSARAQAKAASSRCGCARWPRRRAQCGGSIAAEGSLAGRRILILDDDALSAAAMKQEFADFGVLAAAAVSIPAARAAIDAGKPEALIVDYDLNDLLTGLQFVEALRERGVAPPVVMISGSTDPAAVAALRGSGLPWLTKPVDPRALRSTVLDAIGR